MENSYTMLIVDDNAIAIKGIRDLLRQCDYPIRILDASDGNEAQLILELEQIDILMADVEMPEISGIQLGHIARGINPDISIIMFSAYSEFEYARDAIAIEAIEYLLKPIDMHKLQNAVEKAMHRCDRQRTLAQREKEKQEPPAASRERITYSSKVAQIMEIIQSEYKKDLSLDELSRRMYLTQSYTCFLFKSETGKTIKGFLNECRMKKAIELLHDTNMKVVDVAAAVGYSSSIYFHSLFKKMFGVTPQQVRQGAEVKPL